MTVLRRGQDAEGREVLAALLAEDDYGRRLDEALEHARAAAGTDVAHLYLTSTETGRMRLERSVGRVAAAAVAPGGEVPDPAAEGDADDTRLVELPLGEAADGGVVVTPGGRFQALPLEAAGGVAGAVLLGPLESGQLGRGATRHLEGLRHALAVVAVQSRREHDLRCRITALEAREDVGRRLAKSAVDPGPLVDLLLDLALRATGGDGGFVAIAEDDGRLAMRATNGLEQAVAPIDLTPETGVLDWTTAASGALSLRDLDWAAASGIRSVLAVPLLTAGEEPLGVFAVLDLGRGPRLEAAALDVLGSFAEQIQLTLDNERLYRSFTDAYLRALRGLAAALDERRAETRGHHAHVGRIALAVGRRAGLDEAELDALRLAASVHDIGLAGVAGNAHAFEVDQEHPTIGAGMVEHLPVDPRVAEAIASHHEWWDGWGFPRGLRGDEVPRVGRVLAGAEFIAEMQAGSTVRPAWGREELAAELPRRSGSQFDPEVVAAALAVLPELGEPEQEEA